MRQRFLLTLAHSKLKPSHVVDKNDPTNVELDIRLRSRPEAEDVTNYCAHLD